jgi:formylglycine-generating enzyme required for sulfatase activity
MGTKLWISSRTCCFTGNYNLRFSSSTPVNMFAPSPMGFHDVHGNVWEWAEDEADGLPGFKVPTIGRISSGPARIW